MTVKRAGSIIILYIVVMNIKIGKASVPAAGQSGRGEEFYMTNNKQAESFHAGTLTDGWCWFGAHPAKEGGKKGWTFRVWAPHAQGVSVVEIGRAHV